MLLPFLISFNCPKNINPRSIISACNISYRLKHNCRRLWGLSIFFSVMSWIINSKRSGPKISTLFEYFKRYCNTKLSYCKFFCNIIFYNWFPRRPKIRLSFELEPSEKFDTKRKLTTFSTWWNNRSSLTWT